MQIIISTSDRTQTTDQGRLGRKKKTIYGNPNPDCSGQGGSSYIYVCKFCMELYTLNECNLIKVNCTTSKDIFKNCIPKINLNRNISQQNEYRCKTQLRTSPKYKRKVDIQIQNQKAPNLPFVRARKFLEIEEERHKPRGCKGHQVSNRITINQWRKERLRYIQMKFQEILKKDF